MDKDFISVNPDSGSGSATVTVSASANGEQARSTSITISGGGIIKNIQISQYAFINVTLTCKIIWNPAVRAQEFYVIANKIVDTTTTVKMTYLNIRNALVGYNVAIKIGNSAGSSTTDNQLYYIMDDEQPSLEANKGNSATQKYSLVWGDTQP